ALENPPAEQPGAFIRRRRVRRRRTSRTRSAPDATKAHELRQARVALDFGKLAKAHYLLQEAERVAVAQRKPDELLQVRELVAQRKLGELLEVYELVEVLATRSGGRTRAASEQLARQVETGLRSFV